ncbi:MAG TPA: NAD-dependent epimerase/dehydratase family protein [Solirubrobacteraceae bacterium]|nr:NAD-dependent epimerase/dehydratase family protein [Solirubrobacteraceae bacterium]
MRILVTGASGFIGAHIAARLAAAGAEVRGFCRSEPPPHANVADWVAGDVTDPAAVALATVGCDAVVHTAALYSYRRSEAARMHAVNVGGTRNVLDAAARAGTRRLVFTSSSATCGPVHGRAATERDAPPAWELQVPYKRTKLAAERLVLRASGDRLEALCVNPTTVVGAQDRAPTPSGKMVSDLVEGRIAAYLLGAGINVVAVDDVAAGHVMALEHGRPGQRYILGGEDLNLREAFGLALAPLGRRPPWLGLPWPLVYAAAVAADRVGRATRREPTLLMLDEVRLSRQPLFFSSAKAATELGYAARPAAEALAAATGWFADRQREASAGATPAAAVRWWRGQSVRTYVRNYVGRLPRRIGTD